MKHILFRADASEIIGTGHVMRSLTLAEELRSKAASCHFLCREHKGHLGQLIKSRGFDVTFLPVPKDFSNIHLNIQSANSNTDYAKWLGVTQAQDCEETNSFVKNNQIDWVIVDHYALDYEWESGVKNNNTKIFVIDDLANRRHICDALLDQNIIKNGKDSYSNFVSRETKVFLGPQFALLGETYRSLKTDVVNNKISKDSVLVFFGGFDHANITGLCLEALIEANLDNKIFVIIGPSYKHKEWLKQIARSGNDVQILEQVPSLAPYLARSELAFGAAGSTSWERVCMGVYSIIVSLAENQLAIASELEKNKLGKYIGHKEIVNKECVKKAIENYYLNKIYIKPYDLVDASGVVNIANYILA